MSRTVIKASGRTGQVTSLARGQSTLHWPGVVASIDTERGGDKIAEHTAWVLGRRRFFGVPLFCYVFFVKYHGVRVGHTFVEYADNIRLYWRAHWGAIFYDTFFRVSGEIHNCNMILRFCDYFSLLGIIPQKQSRGMQAKDRQSGT